MSKHTPGPWTVEPYLTPERDDDPMGVYIIRPAHEKLTEQYFATDTDDDPDFDSVHDENQANADYIARCVNSHDALVEALKECVTDECAACFGSRDYAERRIRYISDLAKAALALAGK